MRLSASDLFLEGFKIRSENKSGNSLKKINDRKTKLTLNIF